MSSSKDLPPNPSPYFPNQLIRNQFLTKVAPLPSDLSASGKTIIVTGSNTGVGLECAAQLVSRGVDRLVMAVRSIKKGEAAAAQLRKRNQQTVIDVWQLDMTSYDSIRAFAARVDKELPSLDIVILNAGVGFTNWELIPETGHEKTIQINYISTMLLAILLLPILKAKSSPGKLCFSTAMMAMASEFANRNEVPLLPSFDNEKTFSPTDHYQLSKLLGHLFVWKLTDLVSADDVVVNLVDPGFVRGTDLHRSASAVSRAGLSVFKRLVARPLKLGGAAYLDAALVKGKESHGCVVENNEIVPYGAFAYSAEGKEVMGRLWEETLDEIQFADARGILDSLNGS